MAWAGETAGTCQENKPPLLSYLDCGVMKDVACESGLLTVYFGAHSANFGEGG